MYFMVKTRFGAKFSQFSFKNGPKLKVYFYQLSCHFWDILKGKKCAQSSILDRNSIKVHNRFCPFGRLGRLTCLKYQTKQKTFVDKFWYFWGHTKVYFVRVLGPQMQTTICQKGPTLKCRFSIFFDFRVITACVLWNYLGLELRIKLS